MRKTPNSKWSPKMEKSYRKEVPSMPSMDTVYKPAIKDKSKKKQEL